MELGRKDNFNNKSITRQIQTLRGLLRIMQEQINTLVGGSAPVTSVFTRTGDVTAQSGDYDFSEVTDAVGSTTTGEPTGSDSVNNIVSLTQAEYDAGSKNADTVYIITDA